MPKEFNFVVVSKVQGEITANVRDLPPENDTSFMLAWENRKGGINGQEVIHT